MGTNSIFKLKKKEKFSFFGFFLITYWDLKKSFDLTPKDKFTE